MVNVIDYVHRIAFPYIRAYIYTTIFLKCDGVDSGEMFDLDSTFNLIYGQNARFDFSFWMKRSSSGVRSAYQPIQCQENRKINSNILRIFVILVNQPQSTYIARHFSAITFFVGKFTNQNKPISDYLWKYYS